jgi:hypothetical protein
VNGSEVIVLQQIYEEADRRRTTRRDRDYTQGWERGNSYICYAHSSDTDDFYVGYSGSAGQFIGDSNDPVDVSRRRSRVAFYMIDVENAESDRSVYNCAETSALSTAIGRGVDPSSLFFMTWRGVNQEGILVPPCRNCIQWINMHAHAHARYMDGRARFFRSTGISQDARGDELF